MSQALRDILQEIVNRDPDGKPHRPTDEDRRQFRAWVIRNYGPKMWDVYNAPQALWDE